jgi:hypothetical protein
MAKTIPAIRLYTVSRALLVEMGVIPQQWEMPLVQLEDMVSSHFSTTLSPFGIRTPLRGLDGEVEAQMARLEDRVIHKEKWVILIPSTESL